MMPWLLTASPGPTLYETAAWASERIARLHSGRGRQVRGGGDVRRARVELTFGDSKFAVVGKEGGDGAQSVVVSDGANGATVTRNKDWDYIDCLFVSNFVHSHRHQLLGFETKVRIALDQFIPLKREMKNTNSKTQ